MDQWGSRSRYSLLDVALYLLGAAGLGASITIGFLAMRAVLDVGGFCAEGGPYQIQTHCPEGVDLLLPLAFFGGLGAAGLMGWKGAALGSPFNGLVVLAWPALFISLGWNFLEYGLWGDSSGLVWGWLIPGVIFEVMGIAPLFGLLPSRRAFGPLGSGVDPAESEVVTTTTRKRLLNDLVSHAHERGWGAQDDMVSKLERLATLREQGALTQQEFDAAKRALIGDSAK